MDSKAASLYLKSVYAKQLSLVLSSKSAPTKSSVLRSNALNVSFLKSVYKQRYKTLYISASR